MSTTSGGEPPSESPEPGVPAPDEATRSPVPDEPAVPDEAAAPVAPDEAAARDEPAVPAVDTPPAAADLPPASSDVPPTAPPAYQPPPSFQEQAAAYQQQAAGYGPPPPGYQQPGYQAAGYQPPPPGYPPPGYPPAPGYGAPAQPALWSVALSDGWKAFGRVAGVFIGALVVWVVIGIAVMSVVSLVFGGWGDVANRNGRSIFAIGFSFSYLVLTVAGAFVAAFIVAAFVRNALDVTYGKRPTFADFFRFTDAGPVAILALLVAAIHVVAGLLGWIPVVGQLVGLAIEFFLLFAYYVLLHRKLAPVDAIRASVDLATRNLSTTLVFYLMTILIALAGFVACGIGIFVAAPVILLSTAYLYRRLLGEQPVLPA